MKGSPVPARRMLWLVAGYAVWAAAFVALYAALSLGCEYGWHERVAFASLTVQRVVLGGLFAASMAAAGLTLVLARDHAGREEGRDRPAGFLASAGQLGALTALAATFATLAPVFFLTECY